MPSLILHIGTEKTGTTSTQHFLYRNRSILESAGFAVLDGFGVPNNEEIVWYSLGRANHETYLRKQRAATRSQIRQRRRRFRADLAEAVAQAPAETVIITSEHLHSWMRTRSEVAELMDLLASCFDDIRVIAYFREQYDMARSVYHTRLVHHATFGFREHLASCRPDDLYYDHLSTADRWSEILGADRFHPRVFDRASFPGRDVRRDFLAAIGIDGDGHDFDWSSPARNRSLGPLGLAVMRSLNELVASDGQTHSAVNLEARKVLMARPESYWGTLDDPDEALRIRAEFGPSNHELGVRHFGRDGSPFEPFAEVAEAAGPNVTPEQARDLAFRIVRFVRRRGTEPPDR